MPTFKAIVVEKSDGGQKVRLTDFDEANLMEGDVTVRVEWSTVNYKDGLAITGKAPVVRRLPMIAGIDFAGTVESSTHPPWKPGDRVILNGWGLGETHLVLLCHKFRCLLRAAQHGQRESVVARAATNLRRIVAIEFGTWRSGRNGGSSGLVTFA